MHGHLHEPDPNDKRRIAEFLRDTLLTLIKEKKIIPNRVKLGEGLDKVNDGLQYMSMGKVSAEKLVYNI
jgi:hypothetical protein